MAKQQPAAEKSAEVKFSLMPSSMMVDGSNRCVPRTAIGQRFPTNLGSAGNVGSGAGIKSGTPIIYMLFMIPFPWPISQN